MQPVMVRTTTRLTQGLFLRHLPNLHQALYSIRLSLIPNLLSLISYPKSQTAQTPQPELGI